MERTLLDLANRMDAMADKIEKQASELAVEVAIRIISDLVMVTPVDTSRALSNWRASLGSPHAGWIGPHFYGERGSTRTSSANEAIAKARIVLRDKKPGQSIWITNNVPYIMDLNRGSSRQNPGGFVERAVALGHRVVISYKFKL